MKIFRTKPEMLNNNELQDVKETIYALETMVNEIRHSIGYRRTLLKNADKKLQEFQDTIYAMLMEEEHPQRRKHPAAEDEDDDSVW